MQFVMYSELWIRWAHKKYKYIRGHSAFHVGSITDTYQFECSMIPFD